MQDSVRSTTRKAVYKSGWGQSVNRRSQILLSSPSQISAPHLRDDTWTILQPEFKRSGLHVIEQLDEHQSPMSCPKCGLPAPDHLRSGVSHRPLTAILVKSTALPLTCVSQCSCKCMPYCIVDATCMHNQLVSRFLPFVS